MNKIKKIWINLYHLSLKYFMNQMIVSQRKPLKLIKSLIKPSKNWKKQLRIKNKKIVSHEKLISRQNRPKKKKIKLIIKTIYILIL